MISEVREPISTSEIALLLLCARTSIDKNQTIQIRNFAKNGLDWDELVRMAKKHGVTSLLYWSLNAICPESVPTDVLRFLRQHFQANAVRAQLLTQELIQIVKVAEDSAIRLIPFKGPTLAAMAYGNLFLRDFRDMDLIIAKEAIPKSYKIFESQGYHSLHADQEPLVHDLSSMYYHHFVKAHGTVRVDLQWVMAGDGFSFQLDRPSIVNSLHPIQLHDAEVKCLAPEELLLILCVHGSKHVWEELKWVCDVSELVGSYPEIDWMQLLKLSEKWRCQRMLFLGLSLAEALFDAKLPEFISREITSDLVVITLSHNIRQSLTDPIQCINEKDYQAYYYSLKDKWYDRWLYGFHLCRMNSFIITRDLPWFKAQQFLRLMSRVLQPVQILVRKMKELLNLKKALTAWLEGAIG